MESAFGRIIALSGRTATVSVESPVACRRCAAGKGCGAGILVGADVNRQIQVKIPPGMVVSEGESIELVIGPRFLLRAAMLAYGLPLLAMIVTLSLAWMLIGNPGDAIGVLLAAFGLVVGLVIGRRMLQQESICEQFLPSVGKAADAG